MIKECEQKSKDASKSVEKKRRPRLVKGDDVAAQKNHPKKQKIAAIKNDKRVEVLSKAVKEITTNNMSEVSVFNGNVVRADRDGAEEKKENEQRPKMQKISAMKSGNQVGVLSQTAKEMIKINMSEITALNGNLFSAAKNNKLQTILVTSSVPEEGKTTSAISLAYGLIEAKMRVLLIDGNLRHPDIHQMFSVPMYPGLSDLFISNAEYDDVLRETEYELLTIMPCGTKTYHSVDVFKTEMFKERLDYLAQKFDYVIMDGHSILVSSDVSIVTKYFHGTVIVVECAKTRWEVLQRAKEKINNVGGNPIGIVLNKRKHYVPKDFF